MSKSAKEEHIKTEKQFDIKEIYTPLSIAKKEIWKRWNNKELRKKVDDFWGGDVPDAFKNEPRAALFRFIATPNLEFQLAYDTAKTVDMRLVFMEFLNDKFCTRNKDKVYLGKMVFFRSKNGENSCITNKKKIIDLEKCDSQPLKKIKTTWGENLIDFHHRIFSERYKEIKTFDVSEFKTNGESASDVYLKILPIFICNGILFENYFINSNKDEKKFTFDVILPAFNKIHKIFGVKPLIVPLVSFKIDGDIFWQYYQDSLLEKIKN